MSAPFEKKTCPYCGELGCEAEFTDVGIGFVQTGPYHCYACGATEIGGFDDSSPSEAERQVGWYGPNSPNLPTTVSRINGTFVEAAKALEMYRRGDVDHVPFQLTVSQAEYARLMTGGKVVTSVHELAVAA